MDVGAELRQAREQHRLSLQELADRTKISLAALCALEKNDLQRLPGGIFTRGFVKAYAREVGLDPAKMAQRYTDQFAPPPPPVIKAVEEATPPPAAEHVDRRDKPLALPGPRTARARAAALFVPLALLAALYFAFARWQSPASPRLESKRAADVVRTADDRPGRDVTGSRAPTGTTGSPGAAVSSVGTSGSVLLVDLQPRDDCWISATADGNRVTYRLMRAGERQTIEASSEIVLRVGEPANLLVSINGSPARLGAPAGTPATIRITRQNYARFLAQ